MVNKVQWFKKDEKDSDKDKLVLEIDPVSPQANTLYTDENKVAVAKNGDKVKIKCSSGYEITDCQFSVTPRGLQVDTKDGKLVMTVTNIGDIPAASSGGYSYTITVKDQNSDDSFQIDPIIGGGGSGGPGIINLN